MAIKNLHCSPIIIHVAIISHACLACYDMLHMPASWLLTLPIYPLWVLSFPCRLAMSTQLRSQARVICTCGGEETQGSWAWEMFEQSGSPPCWRSLWLFTLVSEVWDGQSWQHSSWSLHGEFIKFNVHLVYKQALIKWKLCFTSFFHDMLMTDDWIRGFSHFCNVDCCNCYGQWSTYQFVYTIKWFGAEADLFQQYK